MLLAYGRADGRLTAEAIRVVREPDALRERRVPLCAAIRIRKAIAIVPDRHLEADHVLSAGPGHAGLDEHLDARTAEAVACADQVVSREAFGSPRDRSSESPFHRE